MSLSTLPSDTTCTEFSWAGNRGTSIMLIEDGLPKWLAEKLYLFCVDALPVLGAPGLTIGGEHRDVKRTTDLRLETRSQWTGEWSAEELAKIGYDMDEMDSLIAAHIGNAIRLYSSQVPAIGAITALTDTGYQFQRYDREDGFYISHYDSSPLSHPERILSIVTYLNDVDEGGETYFDLQDVAVSPKAGRMCVFPAAWTHTHAANVPISDDKYIISTFIFMP